MYKFRKCQIKEKFYYIFYVVFTFFLVLILNQRSVFTADDYMYHFYWEQPMPYEGTRWLVDIRDIPTALWNHYNQFNGRIVSHAIVMFFMMFDKNVFNICNSIMFILIGFLLLYHIEPDKKKWKSGYLGVIYLSMWLFFPDFGRAVLWVAGSCNYLWMCFLALVFLLPYRIYTECWELDKNPVIKNIMMLFLGFLGGCTSENIGGAVVLLALFYMGYWIWKKKKVPFWSISGILAACTGMSVLLLAPSSQNRMAESFHLFKRLREIVGFSFHYVLPLLIILFVLVYHYIILKRGYDWKKFLDLLIPFMYCVSGAASVAVLILSPVIGGKSWIWADCCMVIAVGLIYRLLKQEGFVIKRWMKITGTLMVVVAFIWYGVVWKDINKTYYEVQEQVELIQQCKMQGISDVKIPLLTSTENSYNAIYHTPNVDIDKEAWFNQWMALYYGVDSITGIE